MHSHNCLKICIYQTRSSFFYLYCLDYSSPFDPTLVLLMSALLMQLCMCLIFSFLSVTVNISICISWLSYKLFFFYFHKSFFFFSLLKKKRYFFFFSFAHDKLVSCYCGKASRKSPLVPFCCSAQQEQEGLPVSGSVPLHQSQTFKGDGLQGETERWQSCTPQLS